MSDNPAAVLVLAVMVMVLYCRPAWPAALAAGAVFGFACMVRCNTILYAPVLLLAAGWDRAWGEWFRPRTIIAGIAGFLLGFAPQMAVNTWFFGAPWRFSYTDYAHGAHTYCAWIFGELNTAYYGAVNHWPWMLGILGLWLMRDNRLRLLLTAWFWPTVLLFLFYSHGTDDAVRFILPTYPAVFLAFAAILPESRDRRGWLLTAGLAAAVLLIPPNAVGGAWGDMFAGTMMRLMPTPGWIWLIALAAAVLLALAWKTGRRQLAVSGGMALVLQLWGNSFILVLLLAAAGVYSVIMFLRKRYTIGDDTL